MPVCSPSELHIIEQEEYVGLDDFGEEPKPGQKVWLMARDDKTH
jgi:hypothetical protein